MDDVANGEPIIEWNANSVAFPIICIWINIILMSTRVSSRDVSRYFTCACSSAHIIHQSVNCVYTLEQASCHVCALSHRVSSIEWERKVKFWNLLSKANLVIQFSFARGWVIHVAVYTRMWCKFTQIFWSFLISSSNSVNFKKCSTKVAFLNKDLNNVLESFSQHFSRNPTRCRNLWTPPTMFSQLQINIHSFPNFCIAFHSNGSSVFGSSLSSTYKGSENNMGTTSAAFKFHKFLFSEKFSVSTILASCLWITRQWMVNWKLCPFSRNLTQLLIHVPLSVIH